MNKTEYVLTKYQGQTHVQNSGILLLELTICIGLLSMFLPIFCSGMLQLSRHWKNVSSSICSYYNQAYVEDYIYMDLSTASNIQNNQSHTFKYISHNGAIISYTISNGRIARKENNNPLTYLYTGSPSVKSFRLTSSPLFSLEIKFSDQTTITLTPPSQLSLL